MARKRNVRGAEFKARVALAAAKGDKTLSELASKFKVHPTQISEWKKQLLERATELFQDGRKTKRKRAETEAQEEELGSVEGPSILSMTRMTVAATILVYGFRVIWGSRADRDRHAMIQAAGQTPRSGRPRVAMMQATDLRNGDDLAL